MCKRVRIRVCVCERRPSCVARPFPRPLRQEAWQVAGPRLLRAADGSEQLGSNPHVRWVLYAARGRGVGERDKGGERGEGQDRRGWEGGKRRGKEKEIEARDEERCWHR